MTPFEAMIASKLIEQGYEVLTSGWPDFCAIKKTGDVIEVRFIEVKGRGDALRPNQKKLHGILHILGLEVEMIQEDANHRMQYPPALASGIRVVKKHLTGRPDTARQRTIPFLKSELSGGSTTVRELLYKAHEQGISRSTLYRTAQEMGISKKITGGEVVWELPTQSKEQKL